MPSSFEERLDCNQLHSSYNPYLLQHAHNPVWWQEWSQRVLVVARGLNRPLFISIGYSTCHWCHVMEEESFSDTDIAELLNRYFISIKIDREERPDLDTYYMNAAHFMGISGGWPLNIFADSEGSPFWIGTYIPPEGRQGLIGFKDLVRTMGEGWEQSSENITAQTVKNAQFLQGFFAAEIGDERPPESDLKEDFFMKQQEFIKNHEQYFDESYGGFKFQSRVKFPHLMGLAHLLEISIHLIHEGKSSQSFLPLRMAVKSLAHMIRGGIYDHLGGGLFRYSTDYEWNIPHFEKMLYDNALLIEVLCDASRMVMEMAECHTIKENWENLVSQLYRDEKKEWKPGKQQLAWLGELKRTLEKTLGYWDREMSVEIDTARVFLAAQDAGDKANEGRFYVWQPAEIEEILTPAELESFHNHYEMIPFSRIQDTFLLKKKSRSGDIREVEKKLFSARSQREIPFKDGKVLLSWNALMVCSYLHIYETFADERCRDRALGLLGFLEKKMVHIDKAFHSGMVEKGKFTPSKILGFLGDYAHLSRAHLMAYRLTGEESYLSHSLKHCQNLIQYFFKDGKFSEVNPRHHDGPVPTLIEAHDGVEPSSQSLLADVFLQLDYFFPGKGYGEKAQIIFRQFYDSIGSISLPYLTRCYHYYQKDLRMISLYGKGQNFHSLKKIIGKRFFSSTLILLNPKNPLENFSWDLEGKECAIICSLGRCSPPLERADQVVNYLLNEE